MPITLTGPDWPSIRALRATLASAPETGHYHFAGRKLDAIEQLTRFAAAGIPAPIWTTDLSTAESWVRDNHIVLGRRRLHTHGSDIVPFGHRRFPTSDWWVQAIRDANDTTTEWRIHTLAGHCIARGLKHRVAEPRPYHRPLAASGVPIRSRADGWHLRHDVAVPRGIRPLAVAATRACGYSHGAVDLLLTPSGPIVLEVNLFPAMDDYTRDRYAQAIRDVIAREAPHGVVVDAQP